MSQVRNFFAGGNTTQGFYSFFHEIMSEDAKRRFILKGGPGTGKSTFMSKIAAEISSYGYDVERFYCSSDVTSLDGIAIPALEAAVVDGTAPHIIEPEYPACVDEIINLGDFWDAKQITREKSDIIELTRQNKACYKRAYHYLKAARELYEDTCEINRSCVDLTGLNQVVRNLINEVFMDQRRNNRLGKIRHLFASAITPQGLVNELPSIMKNFERQIIIKGEPGGGRQLLVERVADYAVHQGFDLEAYHCPITPDKIEHIGIPDLKLAVVSSHPPHIYQVDNGETINLNDYLNQSKRWEYQYILHKNFVLFDELLDLAVKQLRQARVIYVSLEQKYIAYMDFEKIEQLIKDVTAKILLFALD